MPRSCRASASKPRLCRRPGSRSSSARCGRRRGSSSRDAVQPAGRNFPTSRRLPPRPKKAGALLAVDNALVHAGAAAAARSSARPGDPFRHQVLDGQAGCSAARCWAGKAGNGCRVRFLRTAGRHCRLSTPGVILKGMETLELRMPRNRSARWRLRAGWKGTQGARVHYPGFPPIRSTRSAMRQQRPAAPSCRSR